MQVPKVADAETTGEGGLLPPRGALAQGPLGQRGASRPAGTLAAEGAAGGRGAAAGPAPSEAPRDEAEFCRLQKLIFTSLPVRNHCPGGPGGVCLRTSHTSESLGMLDETLSM